ncbi:hypothetical protein GTA08_BOTSDO12369 [Neofusicoccum parvum]|uniref:Uncharacterized protein n=1 Tax=Neofusicoccum parvum TaxID=310453 RepID=A0ACB5RQL7_9PEZI|nr:hypothetical protein GTA08_BOTSDO12369 [Neofusicoccum parvum]GME45514.1 hypothetical protein GTA08_BOTSDO12369 [Neofusicoccum parvum]
MLRARPAAELLLARTTRPTARLFHQTPKLRSMPKDPHAAHTVSQRVRQAIKGIPVEIYPLGKRAATARLLSISEQDCAELAECGTVAVMCCGLSFGIYSFIRPAREDPTLRLHRSRPQDH